MIFQYVQVYFSPSHEFNLSSSDIKFIISLHCPS